MRIPCHFITLTCFAESTFSLQELCSNIYDLHMLFIWYEAQRKTCGHQPSGASLLESCVLDRVSRRFSLNGRIAAARVPLLPFLSTVRVLFTLLTWRKLFGRHGPSISIVRHTFQP